MHHLHPRRNLALAVLGTTLLATTTACSNDANSTEPVALREYGPAMAIGNGQVRTYVVKNGSSTSAPQEIGVAFSEGAMDNLPAAEIELMDQEGAKMSAYATTEILLDLPVGHGSQYKFVQVDWNPAGHEPPGIYDVPHFDFHFYTISKAERDLIDPSNPQFVANARSFPDSAYARAFFVNGAVAFHAPAEALTVPRMGLHWMNTKSPELQGVLGNPAGYKPFTATFVQGSWAGAFIFEEPMITRAHLLSRKAAVADSARDQVIPLTAAQKVSPAGFYATAYRITYDASAKEYRVALTNLVRRD